MMDPSREKQAARFVLGVLPADEARDFEQHLQSDPELQRLVAELCRMPGPDIPPGSEIAPTGPRAAGPEENLLAENRVSRTEAGGFPYWLPWALAAGLAGLCILSLTQRQAAQQQLASQRQQQSADAATADPLVTLKLARLDAPKENPLAAQGSVAWDDDARRGLLSIEHLSALPDDESYHLWIFTTPLVPIDAGAFTVEAEGRGRLAFTFAADLTGKFVVTVETSGDPAQPSRKIVLAN